MTSHRGWLVDNRPPREGGSVWQIFTLEQLKSHSWNIRLEPPTHRSVGRLSALYHRLLLQLCKLRHNSPPQDRLHRSNVTMLARAKPNIPHREPLRTIHTVAIFINPPLANRLGKFTGHPRHEQKRNSKQDHCPIMEKSARRSFQMGALF